MNNKGFASLILIILVVGIIILGGVYLYTQKMTPNASRTGENTSGSTSSSSIPQNPSSSNSSTWEIYENEHFSFQYPAQWKINEDNKRALDYGGQAYISLGSPSSSISQELGTERVIIYYSINQKDLTLEQLVPRSATDKSSITINGWDVIRFKTKDQDAATGIKSGTALNYMFESSRGNLVIFLTAPDHKGSDLSKIIASFKFK